MIQQYNCCFIIKMAMLEVLNVNVGKWKSYLLYIKLIEMKMLQSKE